MKKIALIAYAVSNKYGSEYAVGWAPTPPPQPRKHTPVVQYAT